MSYTGSSPSTQAPARRCDRASVVARGLILTISSFASAFGDAWLQHLGTLEHAIAEDLHDEFHDLTQQIAGERNHHD
jgi:hypothetical protein